jgi:hypothetical protein
LKRGIDAAGAPNCKFLKYRKFFGRLPGLKFNEGNPLRRKRERVTYDYECTLTGQTYTRTEKAPNPKDLISVKGWYEMNPEKDDRPAVIKKKLGLLKEEAQG